MVQETMWLETKNVTNSIRILVTYRKIEQICEYLRKY